MTILRSLLRRRLRQESNFTPEQVMRFKFNPEHNNPNSTDPNQNKCVIFCHGFNSNMRGPQNLFFDLGDRLLEEGISSITVNNLGLSNEIRPLSYISYRQIVNNISFILRLMDEYFGHIGIVSESMACALTIISLNSLKLKASVSPLVFLNPALDLSQTLAGRILNSDTVARSIKRNGGLNLNGLMFKKATVRTLSKTDVSKSLPMVKSPVLLIHGLNDKNVPYEQSVNASNLMPTSEFISLKDSHSFPNTIHTVFDECNGFLLDPDNWNGKEKLQEKQ